MIDVLHLHLTLLSDLSVVVVVVAAAAELTFDYLLRPIKQQKIIDFFLLLNNEIVANLLCG